MWPQWIQNHDLEIRSRLLHGEEDTLVNFVLFGVSFVLSSVMRATGAVVPPLVILFLALWVVRLPFAYALVPRLGADAIWWSFGVGSITSVLLCTLYYRSGRWRRARMLQAAA